MAAVWKWTCTLCSYKGFILFHENTMMCSYRWLYTEKVFLWIVFSISAHPAPKVQHHAPLMNSNHYIYDRKQGCCIFQVEKKRVLAKTLLMWDGQKEAKHPRSELILESSKHIHICQFFCIHMLIDSSVAFTGGWKERCFFAIFPSLNL